MYDKLSIIIDILTEDEEVTSAERLATTYGTYEKIDPKPFVPQIDHITKSKLELAVRAHDLQKSLKLIIFQVEQSKILSAFGTRKDGESAGFAYEWFNDLL